MGFAPKSFQNTFKRSILNYVIYNISTLYKAMKCFSNKSTEVSCKQRITINVYIYTIFYWLVHNALQAKKHVTTMEITSCNMFYAYNCTKTKDTAVYKYTYVVMHTNLLQRQMNVRKANSQQYMWKENRNQNNKVWKRVISNKLLDSKVSDRSQWIAG